MCRVHVLYVRGVMCAMRWHDSLSTNMTQGCPLGLDYPRIGRGNLDAHPI